MGLQGEGATDEKLRVSLQLLILALTLLKSLTRRGNRILDILRNSMIHHVLAPRRVISETRTALCVSHEARGKTPCQPTTDQKRYHEKCSKWNAKEYRGFKLALLGSPERWTIYWWKSRNHVDRKACRPQAVTADGTRQPDGNRICRVPLSTAETSGY